MLSYAFPVALWFVTVWPATSAQISTADCHASIEAQCRSLRSEEALRCRNEADAQCDIADAEAFIAAGDVKDALSRVDQACLKYEDLLNMMLADVDLRPTIATMIRYAANSASIFALLAREGEVEDLAQAVSRLERGREFLLSLRERQVTLEREPDLDAAMNDLTRRLAAALDQLARQAIRRAESRYAAVGVASVGDGGAHSYYDQAELHGTAAYQLVPNAAYKLSALEAVLGRAELDTALARNRRASADAACRTYRRLDVEISELGQSGSEPWQVNPHYKQLRSRASRGVRACAARPEIIAGATTLGIGAVSLGLALGLYAQYEAACEFSAEHQACAGILADSPNADRYTAQVRASFGLATIGGAFVIGGAALLIHGSLQKRRARPRRLSFTPTFTAHHAGAVVGLRF